MTDPYRAGPSVSAEWDEQEVSSGNSKSVKALILPDELNGTRAAAHRPEIFYILPAAPQLSIDSRGEPILSLTLVLERQPTPDEHSISHLIQQGVITFSTGWDLSEATAGSCYRPMYVRSATFTLVRDDGTVVSDPIIAEGVAPRASLQAQLDRNDALEIVAALAGNVCRLKVKAHVVFRTAPAQRRIRLAGNWRAVHDWIADHIAEESLFTLDDLAAMFRQLVDQKLVTHSVTDAGRRMESDETTDIDQSLDMFRRAASVILDCMTPELDPSSRQNTYRLRPSPNASLAIAYEHDICVAGERTCDIEARLNEIFVGHLKPAPMDSYVRLVYVDAKAAEFRASPRRQPAVSPGVSKSIGEVRRIELAAEDGGFRTMQSRLAPASVRPAPASALSLSGRLTHRIEVAPNIHHMVSNDLVVASPAVGAGGHTAEQSLPVVDDPSAAVWKDRLTAGKVWYAPMFELVLPSPAADPGSSPFLFSFVQKGHAPTGQPGIDATVRFVLRAAKSKQTVEMLKTSGTASVSSIDLNGLSVQFALPMRDGTGNTVVQLLPTTIERSGETILVTLRLIDECARSCYGALAYSGYQTEPARLVISYLFNAYVPLSQAHLSLAYGGKAAVTPVAFSAAQAHELVGTAFFDAESMSYCHPAATLRFTKEATSAREHTDASMADSFRGAGVSAGRLHYLQPAIAANPPVAVSEALAQRLRLTSYAVQEMGRQQSVEVLYNCSTYGGLYIQETEQGAIAIGCQETFCLGQSDFHQYAPMAEPELKNELYSVYRSLQQPGRFLVVPHTYRISRYGALDGARAYSPTICLYSTVDPESPDNDKAVLLATVQPDIPLFARHRLEKALHGYAKEPVIEYFTEIQGETSYKWIMAGMEHISLEIQTSKLWDGFQVSIVSTLGDAPLIASMIEHTGLACSIVTKLADKMEIQSSISLDLQAIVGPWEDGPIECIIQERVVHMVNRIPVDRRGDDHGSGMNEGSSAPAPRCAINIREIDAIGAWGTSTIAVEAAVNAGESIDAAVPAETSSVIPVYSIISDEGLSLAELRNVIEDYRTNVLFLHNIDFKTRGLRSLYIEARLNDLPDVHFDIIDDVKQVGSVDLVLPLTTYISRRLLSYRVTRTDTAGHQQAGSWKTIDLASAGVLVSLTWDSIQ